MSIVKQVAVSLEVKLRFCTKPQHKPQLTENIGFLWTGHSNATATAAATATRGMVQGLD